MENRNRACLELAVKNNKFIDNVRMFILQMKIFLCSSKSFLMFILFAILVAIVLEFHLISLSFPVFINLAAIFTAFVYIYALFVVLASFKEHEDRFIF